MGINDDIQRRRQQLEASARSSHASGQAEQDRQARALVWSKAFVQDLIHALTSHGVPTSPETVERYVPPNLGGMHHRRPGDVEHDTVYPAGWRVGIRVITRDGRLMAPTGPLKKRIFRPPVIHCAEYDYVRVFNVHHEFHRVGEDGTDGWYNCTYAYGDLTCRSVSNELKMSVVDLCARS